MLCKIDLPLTECDLKFAKGEEGVFEGYASIFGNTDSDGDTIVKGAFSEIVESGRVIPIFYGHSWRTGGMPVGKGTQFAEDSKGLLMKGNFTLGATGGRDAYALAKDGAMSGLSVGMLVPKDGSEPKKGKDGRVITKAKLIETSILPFPSNPDAHVFDVKAMVDEIETISDCEVILRDAGWSRTAAKHYLSRVKGICQRDVGALEDEISVLKGQLERALQTQQRAERLANIKSLVQGI